MQGSCAPNPSWILHPVRVDAPCPRLEPVADRHSGRIGFVRAESSAGHRVKMGSFRQMECASCPRGAARPDVMHDIPHSVFSGWLAWIGLPDESRIKTPISKHGTLIGNFKRRSVFSGSQGESGGFCHSVEHQWLMVLMVLLGLWDPVVPVFTLRGDMI